MAVAGLVRRGHLIRMRRRIRFAVVVFIESRTHRLLPGKRKRAITAVVMALDLRRFVNRVATSPADRRRKQADADKDRVNQCE
jgi:hypothetical protein